MKFSLRGLLIGSLGAAALSLAPLAVSPVQAQITPLQEIVLNAHRIQIVHNGGGTSNSTNFNITFTNFGEGDCDSGEDDAIATGVEVAFSPYSCPNICVAGNSCGDGVATPSRYSRSTTSSTHSSHTPSTIRPTEHSSGLILPMWDRARYRRESPSSRHLSAVAAHGT